MEPKAKETLIQTIKELSKTKEGRVAVVFLISLALAIGAYYDYDAQSLISMACGAF